jgi:hypothetical protein
MDFSTLTDDEFADAGKAWVDELHVRANGRPESPAKRRGQRLAKAIHALLFALKAHAVDEEIIQPFSGGEEKPEEP